MKNLAANRPFTKVQLDTKKICKCSLF